MASDHLTPDGLVVPEPGPAKVIGVLNIIFALIGIGMGLCCSVYTLMLPGMGPMLQAQRQQVTAQQEAARKAQLDALRDVEKVAGTEAQKAQVRAQIQAIESMDLDPSPELDFQKLGLQDPRFVGHFAADLASNLILNLLMFISGIGLLRLDEWGRKLGIWVAALKIARLLALAVSLIFVVVPFVTREAAAFGAELAAEDAARKARRGPLPSNIPRRELAEMMQVMTGMATGYAAGLLILGSIYPAIALVVLTRPGVTAAFRPREPSPQEPSW